MRIDRRYYCFGCGEKGDAIDFVAKFYSLGKKDASMQIAAAFSISFDDNKGRKPPPKRKRKLSPEQRFERAEKKCFRVLSDYLSFLRKWQEQYAPQVEYFRLSLKKDNIDRKQIYFRGHTDGYAYLKKIGII